MTDVESYETVERCPHGNPYRWVVAYRESDRLLAEAFDETSIPLLASGRADPDCCAVQPPPTTINMRILWPGDPDTPTV